MLAGNLDTDAFAAYVTDMSPLYTALESRIQLVDGSDLCGTSGGVPMKNSFYITLVISVMHGLVSIW